MNNHQIDVQRTWCGENCTNPPGGWYKECPNVMVNPITWEHTRYCAEVSRRRKPPGCVDCSKEEPQCRVHPWIPTPTPVPIE